MNITLMSDLHLEVHSYNPVNHHNADVLVLAGDITTAALLTTNLAVTEQNTRRHSMARSTQEFFEACCSSWKHVVYVAGNHEFYGGRWYKSLDALTNHRWPSNLHFLENKSVEIDGVRFLGSTLWTDYRRANPLLMAQARGYMNDYRQIVYDGANYRKLTPNDCLVRFNTSLKWLKVQLQKQTPTVVVTHTAPSVKSIHPQYYTEPMNCCYYSELDEVMGSNPQLLYWLHGHTHHPVDYQVHNTRVVCNPRGYYPLEELSKTFEPQHLRI